MIAQTVCSKISQRYHIIISSIPTTTHYKRRIRKLIVSRIRNQKKAFSTTPEINAQTKTTIAQNIHRSVKLASINRLAQREFILSVVQMIYWASIHVLSFLVPLFTMSWLRTEHQIDVSTVEYFTTVFTTFLMSGFSLLFPVIVLFIAKKITNNSLSRLATIALLICSIIPVIVSLVLIAHDGVSKIESSTDASAAMSSVAAPIGALSWLSLIVLLFFGAWVVTLNLRRIAYRQHPDAFVIDSLLSTIAATKRDSSWQNNLNTKNDMLLSLEESAQVVSRHLPRRLQSGDRSTNAWFTEICQRTSRTIRELKKHVLVSGLDSRSSYIRDTSLVIQNAAIGNWSAISDIAPESSSPRSRLSILISIAWSLIVAVIPLIFFGIYQQTSIAVEGDAANYISMALFVFALITFMFVFDPLYGVKQAVLRDMPIPWPFSRSDTQK